MPLYEYECEACAARFEIIQRFSDSPVEACRACGGRVHRLLSAPAIQFKGTGWYITDYAKKNGNSPSAPPSSPSSGSDTKADSSSSTSSGTTTSSTADASAKKD